MVLLIAEPVPSVLLIRRPDTLTHHAGQLACPGGRFDPVIDHNLWDAAVRETAEEVGVMVSSDDCLGFLEPVHIRVTGYTLLPVVAFLPTQPVVSPAPDEVADYQWAALEELRACRRMSRVAANGLVYTLPEFPLAWGRLWGATAQVVDQLLTVLAAGGHA